MEQTNQHQTQIAHAYATKQDLDELIKSKDHFAQLFMVKGRFLLPSKSYLTWKYIRQVLDGSKELIPLASVPSLYVPPKISELTVKKLYEQVKDDPRISKYFPETSRPIEKKYFFAVLSAILPDFYETALSTIKENRKTMQPEEEKVKVTPFMQHLIAQNVPYFGTHQKVGHFVSMGRQWGAPTRQERPALDLKRIF